MPDTLQLSWLLIAEKQNSFNAFLFRNYKLQLQQTNQLATYQYPVSHSSQALGRRDQQNQIPAKTQPQGRAPHRCVPTLFASSNGRHLQGPSTMDPQVLWGRKEPSVDGPVE